MKPAGYKCQTCGETSTVGGQRHSCSPFCSGGGATLPLFTRDDLVRAVVAGIGDHGKYGETLEDQARRVVDEMLREGEG